MKRPISPCYKCPNREIGCHSTCEQYIAYKGECDTYADLRAEDVKRNQYYQISMTRRKRNEVNELARRKR